MVALQAGEDFRVYVVLPMYPEGIPTSGSVQAILHFQTQTMEMMYTAIYKALIAAGSHRHPTDYLQFYCLGQRDAAPAAVSRCPLT
jgi:phospholipase D1/2